MASVKADTLLISIRDAKKTLRGGLKGVGLCGSLYIQVLSIDPALRGQNLRTELLQKAEAYAKSKDYSLLYLDTFSFQALPFYLKNGYQIFSEKAVEIINRYYADIKNWDIDWVKGYLKESDFKKLQSIQ
ncbi:MAG: GNAT family N-acetyltransferase [Waddliaceae bacterium]